MLCDTPVVSGAASMGVSGSIKSRVARGGLEVGGNKRLKEGKSSAFQGRPNHVVY